MKTQKFTFSAILTAVGILLSIMLLTQTGCRKHTDPQEKIPTKFTELKVDPSFKFETFRNLDVTVKVPSNKQAGFNVIQIYQGDPAIDGKLIVSGALDNNNQFRTTVRIASRITELYIGKINSLGNNEYVAIPITGNTLVYEFGQSSGSYKSTDATSDNDCSSGCTQTISSNGSYTASSGQVLCVQPGSSFTSLSLTINSGGTVRICGTANIVSLSGTGKLVVSLGGNATLPVANLYGTVENYGTVNFAQSGNNKTFNLKQGAIIHNWGTFTFSNGLNVKGDLINDYHMTVVEDAQTQDNGVITNYCQLFINSTKNTALKITTGSQSNPGLINYDNAYIKVIGNTGIDGQGYASLGSQSLIETGTFNIQGFVYGPATQGSQIHGISSTKSQLSGAYATGYIDFWAGTINPQNGDFGPHVTFHTTGIVIPAQDCSAPQPPVITSSLTAGGVVNQPITPYVITASGTAPITYNATNLPANLTYNSSTHTITGTPATAGTYNIPLSADNLVGSDNKTLVLTVTAPGSPPIITSSLTGSTTVNQPYTYTLTAEGSGPITYNATNLPPGLSFDAGTHQITGSPTTANTYNINLSATNSHGTDNKVLVLTVGTPPVITSSLTAEGTVGQQFPTYTVTASGSSPISYTVTNLPSGLFFTPETHQINGTPGYAGVIDVTLTANNAFGNDSKILVITINEGTIAPVITSPLTASGIKNQAFSYTITATGTQPITFNASNLPAGLTFSGNTISGIPTATGTTTVPLTATNSAGTDNKNLVITITSGGGDIDTDGDGVPDNLDAYPTDPTRAFNSYYPNEVDFATYSFEDLWPAYGDYDLNDLVMNFNYKIVTNAQNKVVDLIAKFKIKAAGASLNNGFGLVLNTAPENVQSVTGCIKVGSAVTLDPKGYEAGHTTMTVLIPVDAVSTLLGRGMVNTVRGGFTLQTQVQTVTVHLSTPQSSIGTLPYNPFMFINQDRPKEVHLKDMIPTTFVNPVYFGTLDDGSDPAQNFYYRSKTNLPWAFEIPVDFEYPVEEADILQTYLHFAEWAQSSGAVYSDWYMNKPGYRNPVNVY